MGFAPSPLLSPSGRVMFDLAPPEAVEYQVSESVDVNALQSLPKLYAEDPNPDTVLSPKEMVENSETLKIAAYKAEVKMDTVPIPDSPEEKLIKKEKKKKKKKTMTMGTE